MKPPFGARRHRAEGGRPGPSTLWQLCAFLAVLTAIVCVTDWDYIKESYFLHETCEFLFGPRVVGSDLRTILLDHPKTTTCNDRYRPFELLTCALLNRAFGIKHRYYLAFQSLLKVIGALSLFFCGRKIFKSTIPPMAAGLFFATNPLLLKTFRGQRHIAVLLAIAVLWAWYFYENYLETKKPRFRLLAYAFGLIALMYNELAFMLPPFLLLYGFLRNPAGLSKRSIKEDVIKPSYPLFIIAGIFAVISYFAGGLGAYRPPLTGGRFLVSLGYLLFRIPSAFLDLWKRGLFVSALKPFKIYWIALWILLLLVSLRTCFKKTIRMLSISFCFYIFLMMPAFQLLHLMNNTPRFVLGVTGLCFCAGSLFNWAERAGRLRKILAIPILALIVCEFTASSVSYWKRRYMEEARIIKATCPAVADHVLKNHSARPPGTVFVIMAPDWHVGRWVCDYFIKALGGRPLSQYLFLAVHPKPERGWQEMQIPEIFWDVLWCEPVEGYTDWPLITWTKRDDRSITLRETLRSEYMEGIMWVSREGKKWKFVEAPPPTLEICREMGWNAYYLKITADGRITDLGADPFISGGR